ncbi:ABC transporter permease [Nocardioides sp.]|uniref:ABC transporter permease n=1 Tax=Nocardioides sp. TaxID=35761 RepID=UPI002732B634|nr:ABC transporter permease [Nocardioides sp.]MDP3893468.1 ABC transporter permease [Nocardioides sp.]
MSAPIPVIETAPPAEPKFRFSWGWMLIAFAGLILLFAVIRVVTGADDVASAGTMGAAVRAAMPIALAGLGGLWAERAGVVNIGLEGMMILGTFGAGFAGYQWGPWAALIFALFMGSIGGLIHAIATVGFGVDHIVSGVAVNIIGLGAAQYLADLSFTGKPGGGPTQSPPVERMPTFDVPVISELARDLGGSGVFFLSDLGRVVAGLTTRVSVLTVIGLALIIGTWYLLWRTTFGLRVRACGENPQSAETLGINVYLYKYSAVIVSGAMAGLGGAFLVDDASVYRDGQTGGRGYIGLAAMIFGNWRPGGMLAGAGLFGFTDALRLRRGGESVHALLLFVGIALLVLAVWMLWRRRVLQGVLSVVFGLGFVVFYATTDTMPADFTGMTPFITTLLVLALASQTLRMPKADGQRYRRGQAG